MVCLEPMTTVSEILEHASKLDRIDRVKLVSSLLEDLEPQPHDVSNDEVLRRRDELKNGGTTGKSEEEFWPKCGRA